MIPCPSEDALAAWLEGRLPHEATATLRAHVDGCADCRAAISARPSESDVGAPLLLPSTEHRSDEAEPPPSSSEPWAPPSAFDDYRVVRPLGRGGMGQVYLAHDEVLDRPVALKFVAADNPDPRTIERLRVEARAIARLQHPNVVAVFRIGEVRGRPYIAYEFVEGEPLELLPKPVPWQAALRIALGLARGLAAAHRRGVLHRDIKPANVMLDASGEVKLLDFGLAKLVDRAAGRDAGRRVSSRPPGAPARRPLSDVSALTTAILTEPDAAPALDAAGLTHGGTMMGTPLYLAPELWTGTAGTLQSDVYALGLVLYELCVGRLPHAGLDLHAIASWVTARALPQLRSLCPDVPEMLAAVIDRCVQRDPAARFASAEEVQASLEETEALCRAFQIVRSGPASAGSPETDADVVGASFARLAPRAEELVSRFYERLFHREPALRALFPPDMREQRLKLAAALQLVIDNLRAPDKLIEMLEALGRRHAAYATLPEHFDAVGRALLEALEALEGDAWTPATARAWAGAYAQIAEAMRRGLEAARGTAVSSARAPAPLLAAETRFATRADASLAYRAAGDGPLDLVLVQGWVTHVEAAWEDALMSRFFAELGAGSRLIVLDQRGTGMSEREGAGAPAEQQAEDLLAVLDAAGVERAALLGVGGGFAPCALLAAAHPARARALIALGSAAQMAAWPGCLFGLAGEDAEEAERALRSAWGEPLFLDRLAPSAAEDAAFRRSWAAYLRHGASPSGAARMLRAHAAADIRSALGQVSAPSLVLHRAGDRAVPAAAGRDLAGRIRGARYVELPGDDHLPFVGASRPLLAELRAFLDAEAAGGSTVSSFVPPAALGTSGAASGD
ncbi:alpha/beta fold hydrolase [Sorangium cellulosum]|uniref:alpha/beta fold hydrolase n=1 Tax=Sorangium cellulosum TaxID=56 RepID=UPI000420AC9C|nr:alpha/beta fold hydrolase [Sorangium cellulosum]